VDDRRLFETLRGLRTESRNPRTVDIDRLPAREILERIHQEDRAAFDAVEGVLDAWAEVAQRVERCFRAGGRLFYAGAGTSGRLGVLDAAECPPTFGTQPDLDQVLNAGGAPTLVRSQEGVEDDPGAGARDVDAAQLDERDLLVAFSASRRTPYARGALERARARGAGTVFVVNNELGDESPDEVADRVVEVITGPEAITGSTRMKAALAQKMLFTMLTTTAMVLWGKVYENLMVDVAPTSQKLRERAKGLVMHLGEVEYERASQLLDAAEYRVKPAIVMARTGCPVGEADALLEEHRGFLRPVLESLRPEERDAR
jgi:N-acetylmuramic acid 6-phosphate etherase